MGPPSAAREWVLAFGVMALTSTATAADHAAPAQDSAKATKALTSVSEMSAPEFAECVSDLTSKGVIFEQPNAVSQEGCALSGAVRLAAITTPFGEVALSGKPTMLCRFGRQLSGWVRDVAAPLALAYTGRKLTQIEIGSAFSCRARYDKPGGIPSEHARGDAIDIASFVLADNRRIRVKEEGSDPLSRDFVHALRMTACGYFTTVLGPGSNPAHAEHLHFDSAVHGATPNYRICE